MVFLALLTWIAATECVPVRRNLRAAVLVFSTTLLLYLGGLADLLAPTKWSIWAGLIILIAFGIRKNFARFDIRRWKSCVLENPEIIISNLFLFLIVLRLRNATFEAWDEYANWGPIASYLVRFDHLSQSDLNSLTQDYPLAHSLFQYLFSGMEYQESVAYMAVTIWLVSCLRCVLQTQHIESLRHRWLATFLTVIIFYFLNYPLGLEWHSVLADHLLGVTFGVSLICAFRCRKWVGSGRVGCLDSNGVGFLLAILVLPQMKPTGVLFAFMASAFLVVPLFIEKVRFQRLIIVGGVCWLLSLISFVSWRLHCKIFNLASPFQDFAYRKSHLFEAIFTRHQDATCDLIRKSISNFYFQLVVRHIDNFWPATVWVVSFILIWFWILKCDKKHQDRVQEKWDVAILFGLFVTYAHTLLYFYLTRFYDHEAINVASLDRYLKSFLFGWGLYVLWQALQRSSTNSVLWKQLVTLLLIAILGSTTQAYKFPFSNHRYPTAIEGDLEVIKKLVSVTSQPKTRLWFLKTPSLGLERYIAAYKLPQIQFNKRCWSIRRRKEEKTFYDCDVGSTFEDRLKSYDFVYILPSDDRFWSEFGSYFRCGENQQCPSQGPFVVKRRDGPKDKIEVWLEPVIF